MRVARFRAYKCSQICICFHSKFRRKNFEGEQASAPSFTIDFVKNSS